MTMTGVQNSCPSAPRKRLLKIMLTTARCSILGACINGLIKLAAYGSMAELWSNKSIF